MSKNEWNNFGVPSKLNVFKRNRVLENHGKRKIKHTFKKLPKTRLNVSRSKDRRKHVQNNENSTSPADTSLIENSDFFHNVNFIDPCLKVCNKINHILHNSITDSEQLFEWMIYPLSKEIFFKNHWEKVPLHIKRKKPKFYTNLLSTSMLDKILRENNIVFSKNLDITCFSNNVRETHNPPGRALPSVVWDYYTNGCSVRLLNPQAYVQKLHILNATLQEFFGCFVGANSYLTPPNSQGFAPHYDDIEAFVLQIEGTKRWRLYKPRSENEYLPRKASPNFTQNEIGKPILDTIISAGDLLYFPRGTIHQGDTLGIDQHSLHVTISVYQRNTWGDLLEKLLPISLKKAINDNVLFRKGLPLDYTTYIGSMCSKTSKTSFEDFDSKIKLLLSLVLSKYLDINKAADEMYKIHIHDFLPPIFNKDESLCSVYAGGDKMIDGAMIVNRVDIELDTLIRLSRFHCSRLVKDDDAYHLYYSCDNSKEYHEYELQYVEVDPEFIPAIHKLFQKFPFYVKVKNLPINEVDRKIQIVRDLWEKGIIVSKQPLSNLLISD